MFRKFIASAALVAASAVVVAPGIAGAATRTVTYQLTTQERSYACGGFGGSIIFSDGSSLDCSTGIATLPAAN